MQTLTTAMGPLMTPGDTQYLKFKKSKKQWTKCVKGASALFACYISKGEKVTVLSPPPPQRFHPSGLTTYQAIEEPILKGVFGDHLLRIEMAHPTVKGAENFSYQIWPVDETDSWIANFGHQILEKRHWRPVSARLPRQIKTEVSTGEAPPSSTKIKTPKKRTAKASRVSVPTTIRYILLKLEKNLNQKGQN